MKSIIQFGLVVFLSIALFGAISAEVPLQLNYQGVVTDSLGNAVPSNLYFLRFRIYDDATGGVTLWDSGPRKVNVTDGLFSYVLGDSVAIPNNLFANNTNLWLGIEVDTDPEIMPRTKFNSVGFSFHSLSSDTADYSVKSDSANHSLRSDSANHAVNADTAAISISIADNSITSAKIVDGSILTDDIHQNGASAGQVLKWNGTSWAAANDSVASGNDGWSDDGSVVRLETIGDSVGIGVSTPLAKLHLEGDLLFGIGSHARSAVPSKNIIMDNGTNDSPGIAFFYANNKSFGIDGHTQSGGGMRFVEGLGEPAGTVRMFLREGGNVGIGTVFPTERLQISGGRLLMGDSVYSKNPLHPGDIIFENGAIDLPGLKFYYGNNKNFGIDLFDDAGGGLRFTENLDESPATTRMLIKEGGNVGIGTNAPSEQLEVVGNIRVGGTVKVGDIASGYELPTTDGTNGQVMTTDGSGQLSWSNQSSVGVGNVPIGAVISWLKSLPGTPALPSDSSYVECNGQTLIDTGSSFNGQTIPDLNGSIGTQRFLRGATSSGSTGGSELHIHSISSGANQKGPGNNPDVTSFNTNNSVTLPSYYEVVWIMRVR